MPQSMHHIQNPNIKTRQFKNGVPQGSVLSHTSNLYTSDIPTPQTPVKLTTYADDTTITSTHNDINIEKANIQSYLCEIYTYTQTNNLILNPDNMHSLHTRPSGTQHTTLTTNRQHRTPHEHKQKILGLSLDSKLTYNKHIEITTRNTRKTIQILKALTSITWGKQQTNHKTIQTRVRFHHIVSQLALDTNINKPQITPHSE